MNPKISVVIPVYNDEKRLEKALKSLKKQSFKNFETIVVDDGSKDNSYGVATKYADKVMRNDENRGPAVSRNIGISNAKGNIIAFTDADCEAAEDWLEKINQAFTEKISAMMGKLVIPKSTFIGDSISALGHPAGGHVGFESVWKVDKEGFTKHFSSCNMAVKKEIFEQYGLFDESFPVPGGEELELSARLTDKGVKIKYNPKAIVIHEPRTSLKSFVKWQITRGKGNYYIKKKLRKVNKYVKMKFWATKNIIRIYALDPKIILIIPLIISSFILQQYGYVKEALKQ